MDAKIEPSQRSPEASPASAPAETNGSHPGPGDRNLPIRRLYSRRHAGASVLFWLAMVLVFTPLAWKFSERIQSTLSGMRGASSEVVRQSLVKNFSSALAFPTAIVWDAKGLPQEQADAAWKELLTTLEADTSIVTNVTDGPILVQEWPRPDWHAAFIAGKATTYGEAEKIVPKLRELIEKQSFPGSIKPWVTGGPALFLDLNIASTESLRTGELIALPVTFIILLLVFRTLVAALLPVIVAVLGVTCTLGILSLFAYQMPVTFFVPNLVTMIGLGIGIDYCLIYLARYRRERANHLTTQEALLVTRRTAGRTVLASAALVMSGFITLLFIPLEFFTSIAVGGMLVVACVSLATLTLLPAMIFLVGPALEWGNDWFCPTKHFNVAPHYERWGKFVVRQRWACMVVGLLILGVLSVPYLRLNIASVEARNIPAHSDSRLGYESLAQNLGSGWMMPTIVLVQHPNDEWIMNGKEQEVALVKRLAELPNTQKVVSVTDTTGSRLTQKTRMGMLTSPTDTTQSVLLMLSKADPQSHEARGWMDQIQDVLTATEKTESGTKYHIGGLPAVTKTADDVIMKALPWVVTATLCSTFLLLLLFMRSLLVAIKAVVLNLFCVLAAYGFQVLCFQDGWGAYFFHLFPTDGLNTVVLVICFCALFGLSMDYEVFILSAVRESWLDNHKMCLSVQEGMMRVGGIISSAAIIMIAVFLSFAFGDVVEIEQLGVGLAFAVLLDATVIRLLLVPSIMAIMDKWAFWCPGQKPPIARSGHRYGCDLSASSADSKR